MDAPAGDTQEDGHTGFLTHLPSAVLALFFFIARRIQPFLSLVDREVNLLGIDVRKNLSSCDCAEI